MYTPDIDRQELFLKMDRCWDQDTPYSQLKELLQGDSWRKQQAALYAIGDRGIKEAVPDIVAVLNEQDNLAVYGATNQNEWSLADAKNETEKETWMCRFRVKQAACVALGQIAEKYGEGSIGPDAVEKLKKYAISQEDDYAVRAVACQALGKTRDKSAVPCLEKATHDGEWCTKTHATVALKKIEG